MAGDRQAAICWLMDLGYSEAAARKRLEEMELTAAPDAAVAARGPRRAELAMLRGLDAVRLEVEALRAEMMGEREMALDLGQKARTLIGRAFRELEEVEAG